MRTCPRPCAESGRRGPLSPSGGLWGRGGPREGGVSYCRDGENTQQWPLKVLVATSHLHANGHPEARGLVCSHVFAHSSLTHLFIHSFAHCQELSSHTRGSQGQPQVCPLHVNGSFTKITGPLGMSNTRVSQHVEATSAPREAVVPILLPHPPTPLLYRGLSFSCKKCVAASCAQKFFNQRTFADE